VLCATMPFFVVSLACANIAGRDKSSGRVRAAHVRTSLRFFGRDMATCILLNGMYGCNMASNSC
jgi:hypothetical protein